MILEHEYFKFSSFSPLDNSLCIFLFLYCFFRLFGWQGFRPIDENHKSPLGAIKSVQICVVVFCFLKYKRKTAIYIKWHDKSKEKKEYDEMKMDLDKQNDNDNINNNNNDDKTTQSDIY